MKQFQITKAPIEALNFYLLFLFIYAFAIVYLFLYGIAQLNLLYHYRKKKKVIEFLQNIDNQLVTIQLPVFNERYVVERLLDAVIAIDYPKELFEIQILDDSTDETTELIVRKLKDFQHFGLFISHIRRENRTGFKAGALAFGMATAKGDFIAIFDADFLPKPDFIKRTLPYFSNPKTGLVQTRWSHLNEHYSLLTQIQAFALDTHFTVEQGGRNKGDYFINFNGTAGVWRKTCIEDAGGWQFNSITEDLDLSYRAQLKGWQFDFLENVESPAELPVEMNALRSQQFRWTKGAAECARMLVPVLLKHQTIGLGVKIHGFFHLMNSAGYVLMLLLALLCYPVSIYVGFSPLFITLATIFQANWLILLLFYATAYFKNKSNNVLAFSWRFVSFMIFMAGLSLQNSVAVVEGWLNIKTPFIRTPKFNITQQNEQWRLNKYISRAVNPIVWFEIGLLFYFIFVLVNAFFLGIYGIMPFYLMLSLGYATVITYTFKR